MSSIPKPNEIYKHFKGNLYRVTAVAEHTETGEQLVIYQALDGGGKTYARPLEMFTGRVDREKYPDAVQELRFERQETGENEAPDPMVMEFLDADDYGQRLNILAGLHHRITNDMITTMAIACDIEIEEGDVEERYEALKTCLITKERYECSRMR